MTAVNPRLGCVVLPAWLLAAPVQCLAQVAAAGARPAEPEPVLELSCSMRCSTSERRVSLVDLHFGGVQVDPMRARLEFTVYGDGFDRDAFATISSISSIACPA